MSKWPPLDFAITVWWSMTWRGALMGALAGAVAGLAVGLFAVADVWSFDRTMRAAGFAAWLVCIPVNIWALRVALGKNGVQAALDDSLVRPAPQAGPVRARSSLSPL